MLEDQGNWFIVVIGYKASENDVELKKHEKCWTSQVGMGLVRRIHC